MEKTDNQREEEVKRINKIAMEVLNDRIIYNDSDLDGLLDELYNRLSKELNTDVEIDARYNGEDEDGIDIYLTITTPNGKYATTIVLTRAYEVSLGFDVYPTK
jgi:hypothetical protein